MEIEPSGLLQGLEIVATESFEIPVIVPIVVEKPWGEQGSFLAPGERRGELRGAFEPRETPAFQRSAGGSQRSNQV